MFALVAIALAASGASVPQTAADQYVFSRPNLPSNIVGVVMGDPPAYSIPRSEDVAWLREAYAERATLAGDGGWTGLQEVVTLEPRFGSWPLSASNQFERWVTATSLQADGSVATNIIVGYIAATNRGNGVDTARISSVDLGYNLPIDLLANTDGLATGFLETDDSAYISGAKAWLLPPPDVTLTNIASETVWVPSWTNCTNVVTMAMTNGTVSVFTNVWTVFAPTSVVVYVTNETAAVDEGVGALFTNFVVHGHARSYPGPLRGELATAQITNHYAFLKDCRRLAREAYVTNAGLVSVFGVWDAESDPQYVVVTNGTAATPFVRRRALSYNAAGYTNTIDYSQGRPITNWMYWSRSGGEQVFNKALEGDWQLCVVGNLSGAAVLPQGVPTIARARLFAFVDGSFEEDSVAWGGNANHYREWRTNLVWRAVVPLGDVALASDSRAVSFLTSLGQALLSAGWDAFGAASESLPTTDSWTPGVRFALPPATHDLSSQTTTEMIFEASFSWMFLLIDFAPRASLTDWND